MILERPRSKFLRVSSGVFFMTLGVLGLILPIIPGILFIILGAAMFGYPPAIRFMERMKGKLISP